MLKFFHISSLVPATLSEARQKIATRSHVAFYTLGLRIFLLRTQRTPVSLGVESEVQCRLRGKFPRPGYQQLSKPNWMMN